MVAKAQTIFRLTRKMVPAFRKIFSFAQTVVSGIENMGCVMQTIVTTTWTTVTAAQKMISVAQTMV